MRISLAVLIGSLLIPTAMLAQLKTIPEQLAEQGTDLTNGASVPSGVAPDLDVILRDTDVIVQGLLGNPTTYLSNDQMTIFSDYPIVRPRIVFDKVPTASAKPGAREMEIVVTVQGGKITFGGLTYTVIRDALPPLQPGSEYLLLLKRIDNKLHVAGDGHFGAFEIGADKKMKPLTRVHDFAPAYRGADVGAAINSIVARRQAFQP